MSLGRNLFRIRHDLGLTQQEVGDRVGLTTSYVSRIENGRVEPSVKTLERLADALGLTVGELFDLEASRAARRAHRCPVSSSGTCIGEQIRNQSGPQADGRKGSYGKEELRLLQLTERIAVRGSQAQRSALGLLLESVAAGLDDEDARDPE